jgi:hypothetical protein
VRQPPAPSLNPAGPILDGASCPCPLFGGTPRLPALGDHLPRKGATTAGPRRRSFVEPSTRPHPLRGRLATEPLAELDLVFRSPPCGGFRIDPDATGFRHLRRLSDPPLREEQACGRPPCHQVGQLSWDFVARRLGSKVRAANRRWLMGSSGHPYEPFASGVAPRRRDTHDPDLPHGLRRGGRRLSLSRARRTFVRRGVLRVASFR